MKKLISLAKSQGWSVTKTGSNHIRFLPPQPDKPIVIGSSTPSDPRSMSNLKAQLKRSGLMVANRRTSRGMAVAPLRRNSIWDEPEEPMEAAGILCIARDTGRVLLLLRSAYVNDPHYWAHPAGAIDPYEDPADGAQREFREETGATPPMKLLSHEEKEVRPGFIFHTFVVETPREFEPRLNWENDDWGWFDLDDLPTPLHPGMESFLSRSRVGRLGS